ncbi:hypothetical protein BH09MYX1_BH09MYX1_61550 [soil metagenome]
MTFTKIRATGFAVVAVGVVAASNGCSAIADAQAAACCPEYVRGDLNAVAAKVDPSIQGQFFVIAQAAGDLSAVAHSAIGDVSAACMGIAVDLGEDPKGFVVDSAKGAASENVQGANYWCPKAVAKLKAAQLTVTFTPPVCSASVQAQASCQAHCSVDAKCDIKVDPPVCKGGTLTVQCKGQCDVTVQEPKIECEGTCSGKCEGVCQGSVTAGVDCDGVCQGTCKAGGAGNGIQGDGSCKGTCEGKCTLRANAQVTCSGSCSGKCDASCKAQSGSASVKCSGKCNADYEPLECKGGTLEGCCKVDADCQANCNASVQARAECSPASVAVTGNSDAAIATWNKNLPALIEVLKVRGQTFIDGAARVAASAGAVTGKVSGEGAACLLAMSGDADSATKDFTATLAGATSVTAAVNVK